MTHVYDNDLLTPYIQSGLNITAYCNTIPQINAEQLKNVFLLTVQTWERPRTLELINHNSQFALDVFAVKLSLFNSMISERINGVEIEFNGLPMIISYDDTIFRLLYRKSNGVCIRMVKITKTSAHISSILTSDKYNAQCDGFTPDGCQSIMIKMFDTILKALDN